MRFISVNHQTKTSYHCIGNKTFINKSIVMRYWSILFPIVCFQTSLIWWCTIVSWSVVLSAFLAIKEMRMHHDSIKIKFRRSTRLRCYHHYSIIIEIAFCSNCWSDCVKTSQIGEISVKISLSLDQSSAHCSCPVLFSKKMHWSASVNVLILWTTRRSWVMIFFTIGIVVIDFRLSN